MNKAEFTLMVAVVILTAKVCKGKVATVYASRIGFCGKFSGEILSGLKEEMKKLYMDQLKSEHRDADRITCRATAKTMECDMLFNGGK